MSGIEKVMVFGAGISGKGAAMELADQGKTVFLYDDMPKDLEPELTEMLARNGGGFFSGNIEEILQQVQQIILSPAVPYNLSVLQKARENGIEVIAEIESAWRNYTGHMVAITGTNGKTTTTTLVGEMLKTLPVKTAVGGRPDVAAILNLTPDHMERHKTMEEYARCKRNIFANQTAKQITILNYDDPEVRTWGKYSKGTLCYFSRKAVLPEGVYMKDGSFFINWKNAVKEICHKDELRIFGAHNEENVLAAIACGFFAGVTPEKMRETLLGFKGVEHRIEYVTTIHGVPYYNDSKATNTDSVIKALEAFPSGHIILLAGGHDKMTPLGPMMYLIREKTDLLILLGEAKERFYQAATAAGVENIMVVDTFKDAVDAAYAHAKTPQVVLLSPACSSFDMFHDMGERGRYFKKLVTDLKKSAD